MTIRILLIDDHIRVHQGITVAIEAFEDLLLVGQGSNGQEAIALCEELQPNVVIMDVLMPEMNGIEATRIITKKYPHIKILAHSSFQEEEATREMIKAGASGYILKNSSIDELAQTIRLFMQAKVSFQMK